MEDGLQYQIRQSVSQLVLPSYCPAKDAKSIRVQLRNLYALRLNSQVTGYLLLINWGSIYCL